MTATTSTAGAPPRRLLKSTVAVFAGFIAVAGLSLLTDQILHVLQVYPPWGQPMREPGLNALALSYRLVYTVIGGYVTARLAPHSPMRHVVVLGLIGLLMASVGAIVATRMDLGPVWYPVALAVTAFPCTWLGGKLQTRAATGSRTGRPD